MSETQRGSRGASTWLAWVGGLFVLAAIGFALVGSGGPGVGDHPEPRANASSLRTDSPSRYVGYPRIQRVYQMAGEIQPTLDGLYCYCRCSQHAGHRSLFTCFETDHGAACDVCLNQAALAYQMVKNGATLDEIRQETDRRFGSGRGI